MRELDSSGRIVNIEVCDDNEDGENAVIQVRMCTHGKEWRALSMVFRI